MLYSTVISKSVFLIERLRNLGWLSMK